MPVTTKSVLVQDLCVPCECRCRYCLLRWDGRPVGIPWDDFERFAGRFLAEAAADRPGLSCRFAFGYSMEHPRLREALRFLRRVGSPQADFLQCDGMRMRSERECASLAEMLREEGVRSLNFTFYGLRDYHDRFAGRSGDFELMLRMLRAGTEAGLGVSVGIPLTAENAPQADALLDELRENGCRALRLFIPHEEGRGRALAPVRLRESELASLSEDAKRLLNRTVYRTERAWIADGAPEDSGRSILISLRADNIEHCEGLRADALIREIETLDERYYAAFPDFGELAARYGDPDGERLYGSRDLAAHYRRRFAEENALAVYDVTDERQSGSRRFAGRENDASSVPAGL